MVEDKLEKQETAHKEKSRMEKLVSVFPVNLDYHLQKILVTTGMPEDVGEVNLQQIKQTIQSFREALKERGIELETYDSIKYVYDLLEYPYPLGELQKFFQGVKSGRESNINEKAAYIFAFFVGKQVAELKQMAQEIDEDYSSWLAISEDTLLLVNHLRLRFAKHEALH